MDWIVFGIVAAAIAYFPWRSARLFVRGKQGSPCRGCLSGASCCGAKPLAPMADRETTSNRA